MIRLPKLSLVLTLFPLLVLASPASAQLGETFSSPDGMVMFTGSMMNPDGTTHVTFTSTGTETGTGHGAYTDGGDGSFDVDLAVTGAITNGNVTLAFGGDDTLTIGFSGFLDLSFHITGTWTVTGATGVFTGAAGGGTLTGDVIFDGTTPVGATQDLEGSI